MSHSDKLQIMILLCFLQTLCIAIFLVYFKKNVGVLGGFIITSIVFAVGMTLLYLIDGYVISPN